MAMAKPKKVYDVKPVKGMETELGLLAAMLQDGTTEWRGELGRIGPNGIVWQPFENGHSIGAILLHIIDVELFWLRQVGASEEIDPAVWKQLLTYETNVDAVKWPKPPKKPLKWYFDLHDQHRKETLAVLKNWQDKPSAVRMRRENGFTLRWLLHHVIAHEAYHGGQAVLLAVQYRKEQAKLRASTSGG